MGAKGQKGPLIVRIFPRINSNSHVQRMKEVSRIKSARVKKVPRVQWFKRYQGCQQTKGAKGAWVKSSEGILGGRVFSRTHFRSSLTPEEGPSC